MEIIKSDKTGIELAVKYLRAGGSVVYPTDTAYGLGVDANNLSAVRKLYKIKERAQKQPIHIIVSDFKMAKRYAKFNKLDEALFKKLMPGPLTIVSEMRNTKNKSWNILSGGTGTIGVRVPNNKIALQLVKKLGRPITATSANPSAHKSGGTTPYSIQDSSNQFKNKKYQPDLFLDGGKLPTRKPSTIVKVEKNKVKILRAGPITKKQIMETK